MLDSIAPEKRLDYLDKQLNQKRQVKFKTCADVYDHWRAYKRSYKKAPRDGIEFHIDYIDTGLALDEQLRSTAPIALALHGAPGSYHDFALLIQHLSQQNVRVIAPNFPEYVATVKTKVLFRHSADEKAAYLRDFLKAINVNKIDLLVSHSSAIFPTLLILLNANNEAIKRQNDLLKQQQQQQVPARGTNQLGDNQREKLEQQKKKQLLNNLAIKNKDIVVLTATDELTSTVGADQNNVGSENNGDELTEENKSNGFVELSSGQCRRDDDGDYDDNGDHHHQQDQQDDELRDESQDNQTLIESDGDQQAKMESISLDGNNNSNVPNNKDIKSVNRNQLTATLNSTTCLSRGSAGDASNNTQGDFQHESSRLSKNIAELNKCDSTLADSVKLNGTDRTNRKRRGERRKEASIVKFDQPIEIKAVALLNPAGHRLPKSMKPTWFKCGSVHIYQHKLGRSLFRKFGPAFLTVVGVPVKVDNMDNVMLSATVMRNSRCQRVIRQLEQLSQMKIPTLLVFSENDKLIEKEIFYEMTQFMKLDPKNFDVFNNDGNIELSRKYPKHF